MKNIEGYDELMKNLKALPGEIQEEVEDITYANALTLERNAKQAAPIDTGKLRQSGVVFNNTTQKEVSFRVGFLAKYAAYIEFGTGGFVNVPPELKELAMKFKGGRGIPFIQVAKGPGRKINMRPQQFLYPALVRQRPLWIKELKRMLKDRTSKI